MAITGSVVDPQTFAPSRQIYGTLSDPEAYLTLLNASLNVHFGTAVLASSGDDRAYGLAHASAGYVIGGWVGAPSDFAENPPTYFYGVGTSGRRAFLSILQSNQVGVDERQSKLDQTEDFRYTLQGRILWLNVERSGYLAYELIDAGGRRRLLRVKGVVRPGTYRKDLSLPRGTYLLRVRIGDHVHRAKVLLP